MFLPNCQKLKIGFKGGMDGMKSRVPSDPCSLNIELPESRYFPVVAVSGRLSLPNKSTDAAKTVHEPAGGYAKSGLKASGSPFSCRKFTTALSIVISTGAFNPRSSCMFVRVRTIAPNFPPLMMLCESGFPGSEQLELLGAIAMVTVLL